MLKAFTLETNSGTQLLILPTAHNGDFMKRRFITLFLSTILITASQMANASLISISATGSFAIAQGSLSALTGELFATQFVFDSDAGLASFVDTTPNNDYQAAFVYSGANYGGATVTPLLPTLNDSTMSLKIKNNFDVLGTLFNSVELSFSVGGSAISQLNLIFDLGSPISANSYLGSLFILRNVENSQLTGIAIGGAQVQLTDFNLPSVPVPSAFWLFAVGLAGIMNRSRKFKR